MSKRTALVLVIFLIVLIACSITIPYIVKLPVPYEPQEPGTLWCGPACIRMWGLYNGASPPSQAFIASQICGPNGTSFPDLEWAANHYSGVFAFFYEFQGDNIGQDYAISTAFASLRRGQPSIIHWRGDSSPYATHVVLVTGGEWNETYYLPSGEKVPVIEFIRVKEPSSLGDPDGNLLPIGAVKIAFYIKTVDGHYKIVTGSRFAYMEGLSGYQEFLNRGGTYYGGPPLGMYQPID